MESGYEFHPSAAYRRRVAPVVARRALEDAACALEGTEV